MRCQCCCNYARQEEAEKDSPRLNEDVQPSSNEATDRKHGVANCLIVEWRNWPGGVIGGYILLEEDRDSLLSTNVAEVREHAQRKSQVNDWHSTNGALVGIEVAISRMLTSCQSLEFVIRGLWDWKIEKYDGENDDEKGDAEIGPLNVDERGSVVEGFEKDLFGQYWGDNGANGLDALRDVEPNFRVFGRTAKADERVPSCLKSGYAKANDEVGDEEGGEGAEDGRGPEDEGAHAIDT